MTHSRKIHKPINPLIYKVAGEFAATFYEAGRSSGMPSKHKNARSYAREYIEKFIPLAVKTLLSMLKPTSNCSEHMRMEIYEALMDPVNDPELMDGKKNGLPDINAELVAKAMKAYDKNKINIPINTEKTSYKNKLLNTANPITPKA